MSKNDLIDTLDKISLIADELNNKPLIELVKKAKAAAGIGTANPRGVFESDRPVEPNKT